MIIYLTINDQPSGVYAGQVADTVNFLVKNHKKSRLVAFVSIRGFFKYRREIKKMCRYSFVFPLYPGVKNWKRNGSLLRIIFFFIRPSVIFARGIFAAHLANSIKGKTFRHKTIFDARGAYFAEFSEYKIIDDEKFISETEQLEINAIKNSDKRLAVSHALVNYWLEKYKLDFKNDAKVIPCTLKSEYIRQPLNFAERAAIRISEGYNSDDIVFVYSGSAAGWQSLQQLYGWLSFAFSKNQKIKLLLLTTQKTLTGTPLEKYSDRIKLKWVDHEKVQALISCGDYGLLIREKSVTNHVSSPTKFAEYLYSGMKIIISEEVGDFSLFVTQHNCGLQSNTVKFEELRTLSENECIHSQKLALNYFTKEKYRDDYFYLISGNEQH